MPDELVGAVVVVLALPSTVRLLTFEHSSEIGSSLLFTSDSTVFESFSIRA